MNENGKRFQPMLRLDLSGRNRWTELTENDEDMLNDFCDVVGNDGKLIAKFDDWNAPRALIALLRHQIGIEGEDSVEAIYKNACSRLINFTRKYNPANLNWRQIKDTLTTELGDTPPVAVSVAVSLLPEEPAPKSGPLAARNMSMASEPVAVSLLSEKPTPKPPKSTTTAQSGPVAVSLLELQPQPANAEAARNMPPSSGPVAVSVAVSLFEDLVASDDDSDTMMPDAPVDSKVARTMSPRHDPVAVAVSLLDSKVARNMPLTHAPVAVGDNDSRVAVSLLDSFNATPARNMSKPSVPVAVAVSLSAEKTPVAARNVSPPQDTVAVAVSVGDKDGTFERTNAKSKRKGPSDDRVAVSLSPTQRASVTADPVAVSLSADTRVAVSLLEEVMEVAIRKKCRQMVAYARERGLTRLSKDEVMDAWIAIHAERDAESDDDDDSPPRKMAKQRKANTTKEERKALVSGLRERCHVVLAANRLQQKDLAEDTNIHKSIISRFLKESGPLKRKHHELVEAWIVEQEEHMEEDDEK